MDKYIKIFEARIQSYKEALEFSNKMVKLDVDREMNTSNFEKNLVDVLMNRIEIKERIEELEYVIQLLSMKIPEE